MGKAIYKYEVEPILDESGFKYQIHAPKNVEFISGLDFSDFGGGYIYGLVNPRDGNLATYEVYIIPTGLELEETFWAELQLNCKFLGTFKDGSYRWHVWIEEPVLETTDILNIFGELFGTNEFNSASI